MVFIATYKFVHALGLSNSINNFLIIKGLYELLLFSSLPACVVPGCFVYRILKAFWLMFVDARCHLNWHNDVNNLLKRVLSSHSK